MQQVQQNYRSGELGLVDVPVPALRPGGILVATACSLISAGTERTTVETARRNLLGKAASRPDLVRRVVAVARREGLLETWRMVRNRLDTPLPLGYSSAGYVAAVAEGALGLRPGDRVACAGSGYASHAEIAFVPRNLAARVPDGVALEDAAYATVGAIALQGVRRAGVGLGDRVAVIGLGLIGQLTVQVLKAAGCRVLAIDLAQDLVDLARRSGADLALARGDDPERAALAFGDGHGVDAAIVTASTRESDPVDLAGALCRERGRVVIVGNVRLDVPRELYYRKELDLVLSRSYGPGRYDPSYEEGGIDYPLPYVRWTEQRNLEAFLGLLAEGRVDPKLLTTHAYDIGDAEQAYDVVTGGRSVGILLHYRDAQRIATTIAQPPPLEARGEAPGISLVGAGSFAQGFLLPNLGGSGGLRYVVATDGLRARAAQRKFGFEAAATDAAAAIDDPGTHAVVIATRHDSHADLVCRALAAQKHVFVEKPLATTREGLEAVRAAAAEAPGRLMVGFNRRFAPAAAAARQALAGRTAPLLVHYRINAGPLPRGHWLLDPAQGGRLVGEACHFVDFVLFLTGERIRRVFAAGDVAIALELSGGSSATIHYTDGGDRGTAKEWIEAIGGGKVVRIDDFRRVTLNGRTIAKAKGRGHREEMEAFVAALRAGAPLPGDVEAALEVTEAMFLAAECLRTGEAREPERARPGPDRGGVRGP
ncbi:MAG TPA: bi-domain-containing oxidoreductase [Planctomycetota bacterium]|nr:bi-domain-containing oxidoreductase [Planctomycetota bacterium]